MHTWILLLRGINVGGRNRLKMDELKQLLKEFDLVNIQTYIQSGNVVCESQQPISENLPSDVSDKIKTRHGFQPRILVWPAEELNSSIQDNPFPEAEKEPKSLHLFFLKTTPKDPDLDAIEEARVSNERFHLSGRTFYLHAPDGIGRSKLASNAEKYLGVDATARNWRTVKKLQELIR